MSDVPKLESPLGPLPPGWRLVRLKEIATKIGSGATPRGGSAVYRDNGTAFVRSQNVYDRYFSSQGLACISEEHARELDGVTLHRGDVLLNITGDGVTFGRACLVPDDLGGARVNQHVAIIRVDRNVCHSGYLLSFLTHPTVKRYVESFNAGGSRRAITKGHIESFAIPLPPLDEQVRIAEILQDFDNKVDLNRRMNQMLEAMAQALFRSWFVDFEPVQAKAEGIVPGNLDAVTAALFPNEFEDQGECRRPRGWEKLRWSDLVKLEYGKALRQYNPGDVPVFGTNGQIGLHDKPLCQHEGVIVGRKGAYRGIHFSSMPFYVIDTAFYVEPRVPLEMRWVYYELLRKGVNDLDSGSAIPSTSRSDFYALQVTLPHYELQRRFVEILTPMWRRQEANEKENRTLASLRDILLPKLLSGEIRVQEAEAQVSQSA